MRSTLQRAILGAFCFVGCRPPPDPERDVREEYMERMVVLDDAGAQWPLASKSYLNFVRGFYPIEASRQDAGDVWRWAEKNSELRVRARKEGPLRLRLRGRGAHFELKQPRVNIRINGKPSGSFDTHLDFEVVIELAANAHVNDTFVVEFESAQAFFPPDDGRELAFSLTDVEWL